MAKSPPMIGSRAKRSVPSSTRPLNPALLALHEVIDLDQLWKATVKLCGSAMPMNHMVAALPFEGGAPMALRTTVPHNDTEAFRLNLHAAEPPLFKVLREHPGLKLADLDEQLGEEELKNSRYYREVMVPEGWRYSVGLFFWDDGRFTSLVGFCRSEELGRFTEDEKELLFTFYPYLDAAIRRVVLIARQELISSLLKEALEHPADGMALMDSKGTVVFQNHAANTICAVWTRGRAAAAENIPSGSTVHLPQDVQKTAKDLMDLFLTDFHQKSLKGTKYETDIPHPAGEPVSARAKVITPKLRPVQPHVRIEFSRLISESDEGSDLPVYRLSVGEHRVALMVARGLRNQEVATELGLSVNTVRAHLREVFSKLGVSHRGQIRQLLVAMEPQTGA